MTTELNSISPSSPSTRFISSIVALWLLIFAANLSAQQIQFGVPFNSIGNSYYERIGFNWGFGIPGRSGPGTRVMGLTPTGQLTPNIGFSFGGGNAFPPFGNFNPNAGGNLNLRGRNFRLGLNFAKGSTTTLGSQTASLIVPNGGGGSLFSGQMTPFVTGVVPIVGRFESDVPDNAVTRAIQSGLLDSMPPVPKPTYADDPPRDFGNPNSTALHGDRSVAALKAERQAFERRQQAKFESSLTEAKRLLAAEQFADSRRKFREAMQYTQDEQVKRELREVADSLKATKRK